MLNLQVIILSVCVIVVTYARQYVNPVLPYQTDVNIKPSVIENHGIYYMIIPPTNDLYFSLDLQSWTREKLLGLEYPEEGDPLELYDTRIFVSKNDDIRLFHRRFNSSEAPHQQTIGASFALNILGPYYPVLWPLTKTFPNSIYEPFVFEDEKESYLYCNFDNERIVAFKVGDDFLSLDSNEHEVVLKPTLNWEGQNVAQPFVIKRNNIYYLFYFGNYGCANLSRGVGVARGLNPLGPFEKMGQRLNLVGESQEFFAAYANIVVDPEGNDVILYQYKKNNCTVVDVIGLYAKTITWVNNWPTIV